jgi:hypothetical protein
LEELIFVAGTSLSAGSPEASSGYAVATEKVMNFINLVNTAVDFRKRLRLSRGRP